MPQKFPIFNLSNNNQFCGLTKFFEQLSKYNTYLLQNVKISEYLKI